MTSSELHKTLYVVAYGLGALAGLLGLLGGVAGFASWVYGKRADDEKARRSAMAGLLKPAPPPESRAAAPTNPEVELGDSGAVLVFAGPPGDPIFRFPDGTTLSVWLDAQRRVRVSMQVRDQGGVVAELSDNEWKVSPGRAFDRNYDESGIEVRAMSTGEVVLQARLVGNRVKLQAKLYGPDGRLLTAIMERPGGVIAPIFRYPSDLHFGERVSSRNDVPSGR